MKFQFPQFNNIFTSQKKGLITPKKSFNVLVAACVYRAVDVDTFQSLNLLAQCPYEDPKIIVSVKGGDALIHRSRSIVASKFYTEQNLDILFFIDDDIIFNPQEVIKVSRMMKHNEDLDIVGGAYLKKSDKDPHFAIKTIENQPYDFGENGTLSEVQMVSTGFMAIHRRVIDKMVSSGKVKNHDGFGFDYFPFFQPFSKEIDGQLLELSEDWAFVERAKELGFKVWVDGTIKLGHAGRYIYDWDDIGRFSQPKKEIKDFIYVDNGERVEVKEKIYQQTVSAQNANKSEAALAAAPK